MMKLRRFLKNLVRRGLLLNALLVITLILGCTSSTKPSYTKEEIPRAVQDISRKEYAVDLNVRLVGSTLWVFLPAEDIFEAAEKPEKYYERFSVDQNDSYFKNDVLKLDYNIKPVPEKEKYQEIKLTKDISDKINGIWNVIRRVLFSTDRSRSSEPQFICLVVADVKNGFEIRNLSYYLDLKKVTFNYISTEEYQHRTVQDFNFLPQIAGDRFGSYLAYSDITLKDFIAKQIQYRIRLKFQKPEVGKNADINKEITKIAALTIKIYGVRDFDGVELNDVFANKKVILSMAAIWEKATE